MKKRNIFTLLAILVSVNVFSSDTTLIKNKPWYIPDYVKIQFAGNVGFLSIGTGYQLLNNLLYSEILYGYVPSSISKAKRINTVTIKNTIPIWNRKIKNITLSPIAGFTASYETGNNSFFKLPDRYPKSYYCSNAFHFTVFAGVKAHKEFRNKLLIKAADIYILS